MAKGRVLVYEPGELEPQARDCDRPLQLKELQDLVGGYIELVMQGKENDVPFQIIVNEEGLLMGLPVNEIGTALALSHLQKQGRDLMTPLVGPVVWLIGAACMD